MRQVYGEEFRREAVRLAQTSGLSYETDFTQKIMQDLTSARTRVLRTAVSGDVDAALALAVYALGAHQIARTGPIGLSVPAYGSFGYADQDALIERREILHAACIKTEPEWFNWCMGQTCDVLLEAQTILIASALAPIPQRHHTPPYFKQLHLQAGSRRYAGYTPASGHGPALVRQHRLLHGTDKGANH